MAKMIFENPANGYRETVGGETFAGAFFLGPLYLLAKGLWTHALIWLSVAGALTQVAKPAFLVLLPIYAAITPSLLKAHFLRKGWTEVREETASDAAPLKEDNQHSPKKGRDRQTAFIAAAAAFLIVGLLGLAYAGGNVIFAVDKNRILVTDKLLMEMLRQDVPAPSSPYSVNKDFEFDACKERVKDTAKSIGAQTATIIDDEKLFMLRFPMPHGSVIASCSALDAKLVITRSPDG